VIFFSKKYIVNFLFNGKKPNSAAHIWTENDTSCRMWSTGGLKQEFEGWTFSPDKQGRAVCTMCFNVYNREGTHHETMPLRWNHQTTPTNPQQRSLDL